jgi:oxygen-independent coproporphyrinogen-3 oxidase
LSLGVQSFDDAALKYLGRTHRAADIAATVAAARSAGFDNISLDLIYAVPGQSRESWRETVQRAAELEPEHVSCYSLTIEEGTPFGRRLERGRLIPVIDDEQATLMTDAVEILAAHGLQRYEISNYAHSGRECRHNLNYWRGGNYLACGCGAHGHRNGVRWWNERTTPAYVKLMRERGAARVGQESLEPRQRLDEIVMLGLRLRDGFQLDEATHRCGVDARAVLGQELRNLADLGLLQETDGTVKLLPNAMPVADAVAARLLH